MIRSKVALEAVLTQGRSCARMVGMDGKWRWVLVDTNETVFASAVNRLAWGGKLQILATDICGDPLQVGAA